MKKKPKGGQKLAQLSKTKKSSSPQKKAQSSLGKSKSASDPAKKVLGRKSSVGPKKYKGPTPRDYHKEQMDYMPRLSTPERKSNPRYSRIDLGAGKKVGSKLAKAYKRTKNK